ncbi:MDR family MFS transporter [Clostridium sp. OS1-26]|uniref:MDR family MFS transporter n=1 Tax=Clostridium sp. OS1-26 TaxID=3070681 RepID=UPI0027E14B0B|nr:MDR family MFS transporter [Clostridium sp. OS1-26]WML37550.1 MDR family MFS transporter [Clostridium sp. OS1-26]
MDSKKRSIVIAVMVAMFLGAVEGTVVTTAVPTIVKELNGFELISWVFSLYLLTSAISTPIYGKLSDLYGRKNVLSVGIIIFLIGSSLCGISQSMYQLIAFRAIQGLGAGSIFTVTYTIVGDVFSLSERAKVQGWLSTVWGIASLIGPFFGGFLIDYLSWHWIFFINIPFGIMSIILIQKNLKENFERKKHKIDYAGTVVLSASIIVLLYAVLTGGESHSFYSFTTVICLVATVIFLIAFYFIEKKAEEPIIPFDIFTKTNIIVNIISFLASAVLIGADVYMPIYMQNVLGFGATISGVSMAPMSVAWLMSSVILAKAIPKYGERVVIALSTIILVISCVLLPTLTVSSPLLLVIIYITIMGFGFGGSFTTLTIVVQSSVDYSKRGAATASNSLVRTLGQTIGVSVFGSMFNLGIVKYFSKLGIQGVEPSNLYSAASVNYGVSIGQIKAALHSGLYSVFILLIILTVVCLTLSFILPNALKEKSA